MNAASTGIQTIPIYYKTIVQNDNSVQLGKFTTPKIDLKYNYNGSILTTDYDTYISFIGNNATGKDLIRLTLLRLKIMSKIKTDSGKDYYDPSVDTNGKEVLFNTAFLDITSLQVTPKGDGTSARYAIYDFTDSPNPTSFKVYIFDVSGNNISGDFSWSAVGY
jgi:hypothetical protein